MSHLTEKQFQAHIVKMAKAKGWLVYHTYDSRRSEPGFPDLVLVREKTMFRELKTDKGKLTKHQEHWLEKLRECGSDASVWRPKHLSQIYKELKEIKVPIN